MFPAFDFDDHIPTILPSFFMLNEFPNIVNMAGKKLSWKKPNIRAASVKIT